jgi:hypothetical protein
VEKLEFDKLLDSAKPAERAFGYAGKAAPMSSRDPPNSLFRQ